MTFEEFSIHIKEMGQRAEQFVNKDAPDYAGNIAVEKFKKNFEDEGFFGNKWQEVQRRQPGTKAYKAVANRHPADTQRKILHCPNPTKDNLNCERILLSVYNICFDIQGQFYPLLFPETLSKINVRILK